MVNVRWSGFLSRHFCVELQAFGTNTSVVHGNNGLRKAALNRSTFGRGHLRPGELSAFLAMPRAAQVFASATANALPRRQMAWLGMTASRREGAQVIIVFGAGRLFWKVIVCAIHTGHLMTSVSRA
ncbi:MAG: hypothetical protein ACTS5I_10535 [Rhodanobacter sp.]